MSSFFHILGDFVEIALEIFLVSAVLERKRPFFYFLSGIAIILGILSAARLYPPDAFQAGFMVRLSFISYIFCLVLPIFRPGEDVIAVAVPLLFLVNIFQTTNFFIGGLELHGSVLVVYSIAGMIISVAVLFILKKIKFNIDDFMNKEEMLLILATFNLIFGGKDEFLNAEPVVALQRGLRHSMHDLSSTCREIILIPSGENIYHHSIRIFEFLSSDRFSMALTSLIVLLPPVTLFVRLLVSPEPSVSPSEKRAVIRKVISLYRVELLKRGTPLIISLSLLLVLVHAANLHLNPSYEPQPVVLIPDGGILKIPISEPNNDGSDTKLRKYSFMADAVIYRLLMVLRPDGEIVLCLDACEICPPRGYVQRGKHLICKYCNTPIPIEVVGKEGGCNPVPIPSRIEGDNLIIDVSDVIERSKRAGSKFRGRH